MPIHILDRLSLSISAEEASNGAAISGVSLVWTKLLHLQEM